MRIEDLTDQSIKEVEDKELYNLKTRFGHVWQKITGEKYEPIKTRSLRQVQHS